MIVILVAVAAAMVGALALRTGIRTLANRHLNPTGGLDNLAVTLLGVGVILLGWAVAGPIVWFLR